MTTLIGWSSGAPSGLVAETAPVLVSAGVSLPLSAQAASRPAAGVATRPATAARWRTVRRESAIGCDGDSGVTDMICLLGSGQAGRRTRPAYRDPRAWLCSSPPGTFADR